MSCQYTITLKLAAVGDRPGEGTLEVPVVYDGKASLLPGWASGKEGAPVARVQVTIETLDDLVERSGFDHLDWLLIDVEGSELAALCGASKTLRKTHRVIIEVARAPWSQECRRILEVDHGFQITAEVRQTEFTDYWFAERSLGM